ncbi:hypothetical protein WA026_023120 [Henosepilachna vigintioctopunctata]|uniref:Uncharacterized protein n=1 Tax=Henosepilachna vigintioctopunctata TaxID=420089 RepID=A0AAW1UFT1_9CUCU
MNNIYYKRYFGCHFDYFRDMYLKHSIMGHFYNILITISIYLMHGVHSNQVYTIVHEKAELLYYNDSIVTPDVVFSFRKVNKTDFAFNTTFTITRDLLDRKIMINFSPDKLFAGEYKRTGTSFTANLCKFYEKNTFGCRDLLDRYSNFNLCDLRKGFYHMYNFIPDPKLFPKFIPYGSYRLVIHVFHEDSSSLCLIHWYARIEKIIKY